MGKRSFEDVKKYVEWQSQGKCNVLSAKPEQHFDDLGVDVCVWNVKTDTDGDWWVVEGDSVPMNLYSQGAHYFGADEVYSFHMGLMQRMGAVHLLVVWDFCFCRKYFFVMCLTYGCSKWWEWGVATYTKFTSGSWSISS